MDKFFVTLLLILPLCLFSQDFSFSPGDELYGDIELDGYGVHQIDIINETGDSLWLTWRLVENTTPDPWDVNLCDNVVCYGVMPTSADMNPIAPDSAAFIRLTTYPLNNPGSGDLHFWIYETGFPQDHVSMTFHLSSGLSNVNGLTRIENPRIFPNPVSDYLQVSLPNDEHFNWTLFNSLGQALQVGEDMGSIFQIPMGDLNPGKYWLHLSQKKHIKSIPNP